MEKKKDLVEETLEETLDSVAPTAETAEETLSEEELHGESLTDRVKVLSPGQMVMKRFFRSKLSMVGLVTIIVLFLFSFIGPLFSPWAGNDGKVPDTENIKNIMLPIEIEYVTEDGEVYTAYTITESTPTVNKEGDISFDHWLGTDENGWDLFTRLMLGGRISLTIGFIVIFLETIIGVCLGGLAGYFGGWVDQLIMRIVDILSCIPTLPIMLILSATLTAYEIYDITRLYYLMIILTLFGWAGIARLVRGQILSLREQEFMLAAKCSGLSTGRKIFKHLLPNVLPQLIVSMTLGLGSIILTEATLGYLGLVAPLGTATWGAMINYATKDRYLTGFPNFWVPPGICITLAILAFNFVGDGLRDAFDPKMKR
ncbi:MAG: ABC transporter permease [Clostridia bacterium]|nr:ABC transporter permease [Clostridia bacterium]